MGEKYIAMKLKDQERSLAAIEADPELKDLKKLRGPLLDLEVRGPAALQYFGDMLWAPAFDGMAASESEHCLFSLFGPARRCCRGVVQTIPSRSIHCWEHPMPGAAVGAWHLSGPHGPCNGSELPR